MSSPILADDLPLCDVLAALDWTTTRTPGRHNTVTDPASKSLTAHAGDVWALLVRRGLITGFPPGWVSAYGNAPDPTPRPCQCWRLAELPT